MVTAQTRFPTVSALSAAFCALSLIAAPPPAEAGGPASAPADAVLLMHLEIKEDDPGQRWVFDRLTGFLVAQARQKRDSARLGDVNLFRFADFCFSLLPRDREGRDRLLLDAALLPGTGRFDLTYGDRRFQLNIRDEETAAGAQTALLSIVLSIICEIRAGGAPEDGIYFNAERAKKGRFSAYYVSDTRALLATDRGLIAGALAEKGGIARAPLFAAAMELLPRGWDAYGYANDEKGGLSAYLREKEKGWATLVLALLDPARRVGLALDVEDRDRCRVVAVFPLPGPAEAKALRAKLEPVLSALLAEYLDEGLKSEISFEELPRALRVSARFSNTARFWEKAFGGTPERTTPPRDGVEAPKIPASTAPPGLPDRTAPL